MKKNMMVWLLALALGGSLLATAAFAGESADSRAPEESQEEAQTGEADAAEAPRTEGDTGETAEQEPPTTGKETAPVQEGTLTTGGFNPELSVLQPDPAGQLSFGNMESRMRENNLQILALQGNIDTIEDIDYDELYEDLRQQLNEIAKAQWGLVTIPPGMVGEYERDKTYDQLEQAYDAVREKFDAIKEGDMQKDNADLVRQLTNLQDQIVVAGESTYIALQAMEIQEEQLQRQLAALNRTTEEMELRYQMGQVSALQLQQTKAGRSQLQSGLETLRMNIRSLKTQLEQLIGAQQTGEIVLGAVPEVREKQLAAMDLEKDLLAYQAKSYDLYDAAKTLEDAQETYKDDASEYGYNEEKYGFRAAKRTWETAQYTYNNTLQTYELKFRALYAQVLDNKQVLDSARVSLECEKASYAAAELRYQQGTISENALLDAKDSLQQAEETVRIASNELFSSYNTYRWAVERGVLN